MGAETGEDGAPANELPAFIPSASRGRDERAAAPAPARSEAAPSERSLFAADDEDDLPAPAYRPEPAEEATRAVHVEDEAQFVAPRPRLPGTPTPEALARLQAAVNRAPVQGQAPRPAPAAARDIEQPRQAADKGRFGINNLLNRMSGHGHESAERVAPSVRAQPRVTPVQDADPTPDPDHERVEIPAFLRRQAN